VAVKENEHHSEAEMFEKQSPRVSSYREQNFRENSALSRSSLRGESRNFDEVRRIETFDYSEDVPTIEIH
jgi:hypothetical protein